MKKALLFISVFCVSSQAYSQSNVSLSGGFMTGIKHTAEKKNGTPSKTRLENLGVPANHLTVRGTERINNDLSVGIVLNHRFDPTNGSVNGSSFFTNSKISLSSAYGSLSAGKFWAPVDWILRPTFDIYGPVGIGGVYGSIVDAPSRYDGMLMYESPDISGLKFALMFVPKSSMASDEANVYEAALRYKYANMDFGIGYTKNAGTTPTARDNIKGKDVLTLATGIHLKDWRMGLTYTEVDAHAANPGSKRYSLGLRKKISDQLTIKSGLEQHKINAGDETTAFAVGLEYSLSKRTSLFTELGRAKSDNHAKHDVEFSYTAGIQHRF